MDIGDFGCRNLKQPIAARNPEQMVLRILRNKSQFTIIKPACANQSCKNFVQIAFIPGSLRDNLQIFFTPCKNRLDFMGHGLCMETGGAFQGLIQEMGGCQIGDIPGNHQDDDHGGDKTP
ncbi:hypothetical protein [Desulfococcus sp.]|uniref:hypothetical protein n=1 Tax=Desulfococcus sp. TaxID=2025834 RepID=UPI003593EBD0